MAAVNRPAGMSVTSRHSTTTAPMRPTRYCAAVTGFEKKYAKALWFRS
jgi:hypothetical protein